MYAALRGLTATQFLTPGSRLPASSRKLCRPTRQPMIAPNLTFQGNSITISCGGHGLCVTNRPAGVQGLVS
jgi:hypothetical protein